MMKMSRTVRSVRQAPSTPPPPRVDFEPQIQSVSSGLSQTLKDVEILAEARLIEKDNTRFARVRAYLYEQEIHSEKAK